jgi:hypothetical protein
MCSSRATFHCQLPYTPQYKDDHSHVANLYCAVKGQTIVALAPAKFFWNTGAIETA